MKWFFLLGIREIVLSSLPATGINPTAKTLRKRKDEQSSSNWRRERKWSPLVYQQSIVLLGAQITRQKRQLAVLLWEITQWERKGLYEEIRQCFTRPLFRLAVAWKHYMLKWPFYAVFCVLEIAYKPVNYLQLLLGCFEYVFAMKKLDIPWNCEIISVISYKFLRILKSCIRKKPSIFFGFRKKNKQIDSQLRRPFFFLFSFAVK